MNDPGRIRPFPPQPAYWQYQGHPVLLLGGSKIDSLFLIEDLERHLDEIAAAGGNYVRNTMSQRHANRALRPHRWLPGPRKFDLDQWNDRYWQRFQNLLEQTRQRQIIVQLEVWDRFDYGDGEAAEQKFWTRSAWRASGNVNYDDEAFDRPYAWGDLYRDRHPFFHTAGAPASHPRILDYQRRFIGKLLDHSLDFGNVLYCMNNETSSPPSWGQYWIKYIRDRARRQGVDVYLSDMFDDGWKGEGSASYREVIDQPDVYRFVDVSQVNSRNTGREHWRRMRHFVRAVVGGRPINHTKIYGGRAGEDDGAAGSTFGSRRDGIGRFWRNLVGGCAAVRFHREHHGLGSSDLAKASIQAARRVERRFPLWDVEPRMDLLPEAGEDGEDGDRAYLAADRDVARLLLFATSGGSRIPVDLSIHPGAFELTWIDLASAEERPAVRIEGGAVRSIPVPEGPWGWVATLVVAPAGP